MADLRLGERVMRLDGTTPTATALAVRPGVADYYNLTVSQVHTYAVGVGQFVVHNCGNTTPEDIFRSGGGRDGKRVTARELDHNVDPGDPNDMTRTVHAPSDPAAEGGTSTFTSVDKLRPGGNAYRLPAGTELPDGMGYVADGSDVGGIQVPGHRSLYPTRDMPWGEWNQMIHDLPWDYVGKT